ncbi:MAG: TolC family protein [Crocinitomicaceae bacterium]|nr:TolC family protein [Crocinitomicaceae bacterium]
MDKRAIYSIIGMAVFAILINSCGIPKIAMKEENTNVPTSYNGALDSTIVVDSTNTADLQWREFFKDTCLVALIDTALKNNMELNITLAEITAANSEIMRAKGEILPDLNLRVGAGIEKVGRHTSQGAADDMSEIADGKKTPEHLPDFGVGLESSWEIDIWRKLRNARDAAFSRYSSSIEAKNYMVTKLVSEIAHSYFELIALDNEMEIIQQNLEIQKNALEIVKLQKEAAKVTELAIRKFEAEVLKNRSRLFYVKQQIVETENRINFLVGRFPQPVIRNSSNFMDLVPDSISTGVPSQLLENRPDIRMAEYNLIASKLDVKVAKAKFFPSLRITLGVGYNAFNFKYFFNTPASLAYNILGDLIAPLLNRAAIKAEYISANARQLQAVYEYEKTILNAYTEVMNNLSKIDNLKQSYDLKSLQVEALNKSINVANTLFMSARADYMEVLLTQRDALEAKMELIEIKQQQLSAVVSMYRVLGGGWQ